jgi:hypothetical protein
MTSLNEFRLKDYIQHMLQAIQRIEAMHKFILDDLL